MPNKSFIISVVAAWLIASGCVKKGCIDPDALNYNPKAQRDDQSCEYGDKFSNQKDSVLVHHAEIAFALYADAHLLAVLMDSAINTFVKSPTDDNFSKAKLAWRNAHGAFMRCEVLRYSDGPVDDDRNFYNLMGDWPIKPSVIDYTASSKKGIVNVPDLLENITGAKLMEYGSTKGEITTGFHVIEFLLWGEDTEDAAALTPGLRPFTDYDQSDSTVLNAKRRSTYLVEASKLLLSQLTIVKADWQAQSTKNYRTKFVALAANTGLRNILKGLTNVSSDVLAQKALIDPIKSHDPLDEISAFSDNTQIDLVAAVDGIKIVYNGLYLKSAQTIKPGMSVHSLMLKVDPELEAKVQAKLDELTESVENIPAPFDWQVTQEDLSGTGSIMQTAQLLNEFEALMLEVARVNGFGLGI